jgi:hypothetical protein
MTRLTPTEQNSVAEYINAHQHEHRTKRECLAAAVQHIGSKLKINSNAIHRYYTLSKSLPRMHRKYTRRAKPVAREIQVRYCPNCGCNLEAVATGIAMSQQ